jgi:MFS family permease
MQTAEQSLRYPGWRVAFSAAAGVFVSFASLLVYTFGVFLKPLASEFHWSREAVSGAFGLAALGVAACSPFIGMLLDRFPARRIILPCMLVFGCGFASLALLTNHLWQLYGTFILLGIVGNGTAHLAYARAVSTWFVQRRGAAFALLMSGGAVGAMVLPIFSQSLISHLGWSKAFVVLGAMVLVVGLPMGSRIRERPAAERIEEDTAGGTSVSEALRSWIFWIIVTVLFFGSLTQNGSLTHLAALLSDRGVPVAQAAAAVSVLGFATLMGRLLTGWLLDRYFAPGVAVCLLVAASLGTFILSGARSAPMGFLGAGLIGLGMGGEADITPYLISRYFGLRSFSTLYGLSWTVYAIAGAIGPAIMGKAFDATGSYQALLFRLAVMSLATAALMLFLPRFQTTLAHGCGPGILNNAAPVSNS